MTPPIRTASVLEPVWLVAFTGHRPSGDPGRSAPELAAARASISAALAMFRSRAQVRGGRIELVTGAGAGADIEAIEAAEALGIPVHVVLPLSVEEFKKDFTGPSAGYQERATRAIEKATSGAGGWTVRTVWGAGRPECYLEAGLETLLFADALVALWDNRDAQGMGGTADIVREARRVGMPCVTIDPAAPAAPADGSIDAAWPAPDQLLGDLAAELGAPPASATSSARALLDHFDQSATAAAGHFRRRLVLALLLHFAAALLAGMGAAWSPVLHARVTDGHGSISESLLHLTPKVLTGIEFVLVSIAWYVMFQTNQRRSHGRWRKARFAAELTRSLIASARVLDPLWPLIGRYDARWKRFALGVGLAATRERPPQSLEDRREAYLAERLTGQIEHFAGKLKPATRWMGVLGVSSEIATIAAPVVIGVALVLKLMWPELPERSLWAAFVTFFLPVALPLIAGAATSLMVAIDAGRRTERYASMVQRLRRLSVLLPAARTERLVRRAVSEAEDLMMGELAEWHTATKHVGH
jgi:hypothetical protein